LQSVASRAHCAKVVEDVVVKKFTFAISSPDEFLVLFLLRAVDRVLSAVLPCCCFGFRAMPLTAATDTVSFPSLEVTVASSSLVAAGNVLPVLDGDRMPRHTQPSHPDISFHAALISTNLRRDPVR